MPSEQPNENMDKVLKAYAKKRREDSSQIEMDLPTRNMLQAEVKRTLAEVPVPAATKPRPRFAWWPQLIIGVASAAALAIAVLVWKLPSRTESNESAAVVRTIVPETPVVSAPPVNTPTASLGVKDNVGVVENGRHADGIHADGALEPTPHVKFDKNIAPELALTITNSASTDLASEVVAKDFSAPAATPTPSAILESRGQSIVGINSTSLAPTATASPAVAAPAATPLPTSALAAAAPAAQLASRSLAKTESADVPHKKVVPQKQQIRFSQVNNRSQYRVNLNSPPLPKVLTTFRLERTGTNLLVRDSDGSVYSGKAFANTPSQNRTQAFVVGGAIESKSSDDSIPEDNFAFRVTGYNKKLRQKIVFTGNVINSQQNAPGVTNALADQQLQPTNNAQNILLNGRVQVGRNSEFDIQAEPVTK